MRTTQLVDGEAEYYQGVSVEFVKGRKAVLTIYQDGEEIEEINLQEDELVSKRALHDLFQAKGFVLRTDLEKSLDELIEENNLKAEVERQRKQAKLEEKRRKLEERTQQQQAEAKKRVEEAQAKQQEKAQAAAATADDVEAEGGVKTEL